MTATTLLVLLGILVVGGYFGLRSLFAPLPGDSSSSSAPKCTSTSVQKGQRILARQVEVSVFNGGTRAGLADRTMSSLSKRGFEKGDVGNAPTGSKIKVAQVWTTKKVDPAAHLVARQFGPTIKVRTVRTDLGPGVDVLVGNGFHALKKAKPAIVVQRSSSVCIPDATSSPSSSPSG